MGPRTIEERIAQLASKVALLMAKTHPGFLDTTVGIHAGSPLFEEVVRTIEEDRRRAREEVSRLNSKSAAAS